jgi:uncharacterized membrane protein
MPKQEVGFQLATSTFYLKNIVLNVVLITLPLMGNIMSMEYRIDAFAYAAYFVNYMGNSILHYVASSYVMSNFGKNYNNIDLTIAISSTILVVKISSCSGYYTINSKSNTNQYFKAINNFALVST